MEGSITLVVEDVSIEAEVAAEVAVMSAATAIIDQEHGSHQRYFVRCPLKINKLGSSSGLSRGEARVILWQAQGRTLQVVEMRTVAEERN